MTLEELCMQYEGNMKRGIKHVNKIPETLDELKEMFEIQEQESKIKSLDEIALSVSSVDTKISTAKDTVKKKTTKTTKTKSTKKSKAD